MTLPYLTPLDAIAPPTWARVGAALLTTEPLRDASTGLFARLTYRDALAAAVALDASLVTPDDVEALHAAARAGKAVELAPCTLPSVAMVRAAGYVGAVKSEAFQAAAQRLRGREMRGEAWCRMHDETVARGLLAAAWDGVEAVAGAGKHWVAGAPAGRSWLMGWWANTSTGGRWIQPRPAPGSRGPHNDLHTDYATTTMLRRPLAASTGERSSLGLRALELSLVELAADVREEPSGSNDGPRIRVYRAGAMRKGRPLRAGPGPWCAYAASWAAWTAEQDSPPPGSPVPHGWRASVAELIDDARAEGAWHDAGDGYQPAPGDLACFGRAGGDPRRGGAGHVGRVESVTPETVTTIDANVGDRWARVTRPMASVLGWIAYPGGAA